ncbi:MAG: hypothetical protein ACLP8Y_03365 [Thermoplasmata archaeon]
MSGSPVVVCADLGVRVALATLAALEVRQAHPVVVRTYRVVPGGVVVGPRPPPHVRTVQTQRRVRCIRPFRPGVSTVTVTRTRRCRLGRFFRPDIQPDSSARAGGEVPEGGPEGSGGSLSRLRERRTPPPDLARAASALGPSTDRSGHRAPQIVHVLVPGASRSGSNL